MGLSVISDTPFVTVFMKRFTVTGNPAGTGFEGKGADG